MMPIRRILILFFLPLLLSCGGASDNSDEAVRAIEDSQLTGQTTGGVTATAATAPADADADTQQWPTRSDQAMAELLDTVREVQATYLQPRFGIDSASKRAEAQRTIAHILHTGLEFWLEANPERPVFKPYVTTTRKLLGDNPDALYYFAPLRDDRRYRITGNIGSAVFTSFTIEGGSGEGRAASSSLASISDKEMDIAPDGSFDITVSRERPTNGNWLPLKDGAGQITTRHYHENRVSIAANPRASIELRIEALEPAPLTDYRGDAEVARKLGYVSNFVAGLSAMTLVQPTEAIAAAMGWYSLEPNQFNQPGQWLGAADEQAYGNTHAYYAAAPYALADDEALIIEGNFPQGLFANVVVWNHFMQTLDFANRQISLNRKQIQYRDDGSFRLIVSHDDPGLPNWLDTEGRSTGVIYWRWIFPTEQPPTPQARVVKLADLHE